jgi:hypothetical protein
VDQALILLGASFEMLKWIISAPLIGKRPRETAGQRIEDLPNPPIHLCQFEIPLAQRCLFSAIRSTTITGRQTQILIRKAGIGFRRKL